MTMLNILLWLFVGGLVGYMCGKARGREQEGMALGALIGPLGWLLILAGNDARPKCPDCRGVIPDGARKCMHCGAGVGGSFRQSKVPGVELKCPACGEIGFVPEVSEWSEVECPICKRKFKAVTAMV